MKSSIQRYEHAGISIRKKYLQTRDEYRKSTSFHPIYFLRTTRRREVVHLMERNASRSSSMGVLLFPLLQAVENGCGCFPDQKARNKNGHVLFDQSRSITDPRPQSTITQKNQRSYRIIHLKKIYTKYFLSGMWMPAWRALQKNAC